MKLILKKEEFIFDERDDSKNLNNINAIHLMLLLNKENLGLIFDLIRNIESGNLYAVFEQLDSSIAKEFLKISMSRPIIGRPLSDTKGFGVATPSCCKRDPSPAAIIAKFI